MFPDLRFPMLIIKDVTNSENIRKLFSFEPFYALGRVSKFVCVKNWIVPGLHFNILYELVFKVI